MTYRVELCASRVRYLVEILLATVLKIVIIVNALAALTLFGNRRRFRSRTRRAQIVGGWKRWVHRNFIISHGFYVSCNRT